MSARAVFEACLMHVRKLVPEAAGCSNWRGRSNAQLQNLCAAVFGALADDDERRERFLHAEARLSSSSMLVKHVPAYRNLMDEVIFYQRARDQIVQTMPGEKPRRESERTVRDLGERTSSAGVIDIFRAAGYAKANLSLIDENLFANLKSRAPTNLQLKLLQKLLEDEIERSCRHEPLTKASLRQSLAADLHCYYHDAPDPAALLAALVSIRRQIEAVDSRTN